MLNASQRAILRKMYFDKIIGGKHTAIENLKKGFPSHVRGDIDDEVKKTHQEWIHSAKDNKLWFAGIA